MSGQVIVVLRWESFPQSRIEGECFADLRSIGRFSIRRKPSGPSSPLSGGKRRDWQLLLNNKLIAKGDEPSELKLAAQDEVSRRMISDKDERNL